MRYVKGSHGVEKGVNPESVIRLLLKPMSSLIKVDTFWSSLPLGNYCKYFKIWNNSLITAFNKIHLIHTLFWKNSKQWRAWSACSSKCQIKEHAYYILSAVLKHLAYRVNAKKRDISTIIHSFERARKVRLADVICYCKMTSVMAIVIDWKTIQIHVMYVTQSNYWREFFSAMAEGLKKLKTSNVFSSFIVC